MELLPFYDVVIVGGGVAGCAVALALQQTGLHILLVDPCKVELYKPGESLPGAAVRLLLRLGIKGMADLLAERSYKVCIANASCWGSDQWMYKDAITNPEGGGWHINRNDFDTALRYRVIHEGVPFCAARLHQIGKEASITSNETAYTIQIMPNNGHLRLNTHSKWLIDATGRGGFVSRKMGIKQQRFSRQMAAVAWFRSPKEIADQVTRIKSVWDGWWYTALLPDKTRVINFCSTPHTIRQIGLQPQLFCSKLNEARILPFDFGQDTMIQLKTIDASMKRGEKVIKENFLSVGDAAISFDPLSSQGIYFALYSGIKAAEAIIKSEKGLLPTEALSQYQLQINQVFEAVQRQRSYFYKSEHRYVTNEYWQECAMEMTKTSGLRSLK